MLTIAEKVHEGNFALWIYGSQNHKTQVWRFLQKHQARIEKQLETRIRCIDSSPRDYSHEHNFKLLEGKVWEIKFVSQKIRLACVWDPKPQTLVIFYGFEKKVQKWPGRELDNMRNELQKYYADKLAAESPN